MTFQFARNFDRFRKQVRRFFYGQLPLGVSLQIKKLKKDKREMERHYERRLEERDRANQRLKGRLEELTRLLEGIKGDIESVMGEKTTICLEYCCSKRIFSIRDYCNRDGVEPNLLVDQNQDRLKESLERLVNSPGSCVKVDMHYGDRNTDMYLWFLGPPLDGEESPKLASSMKEEIGKGGETSYRLNLTGYLPRDRPLNQET